MKIGILSQNHLCRNPRVLKEALMLSSRGYIVEIGTVWYSHTLYALDLQLLQDQTNIRYQTYADLRPGKFLRNYYRFRFHWARFLKKYFHIETAELGGYGASSLLNYCKQNPSDLFIAHQEVPTLLAAQIKGLGFKIGMDLEDWYSQDLLPQDRKFRPIKLLEEAESFALNQAQYSVTTSESMAEALWKTYGGNKPIPIYNSFSLEDRKNMNPSQGSTPGILRLAWVSQLIGHGRGLEEMILYLLKTGIPAEIHLAGNLQSGFDKILENTYSHTDQIRVFFYPILHPTSIVNWLSQFDAGIASEPRLSYSTDLTVSNKIIYYLLAGIPVLAFPTSGHKEIADLSEGAVHICGEAETDKNIIMEWANKNSNYLTLREKAWNTGTRISWENQAPQLLSCIESAVSK